MAFAAIYEVYGYGQVVLMKDHYTVPVMSLHFYAENGVNSYELYFATEAARDNAFDRCKDLAQLFELMEECHFASPATKPLA